MTINGMLVQRVFLDLPAVVARAGANGMEIDNPEGWLRRRAYLMGRQMLRDDRSAVRAADSIDEQASAPLADTLLDTLDARHISEQLQQALRVLERERPLWAELLRLHHYDGYRLDEIAERMGRTHGTIRNDAVKARARLETIIRDQFPALASERRNGQRP